MALGIVVAGVGVGVLIYAPLANYLISIFGWRTAYIQIGLGTALLLVLSALFATTPERKGLKPYGFEELKGGTLVTPANLGIGQAIKARAFWLVTLVYFLFHVNVFMVNVHLVPFAELAGMGKAGASAAWGLVGGVSIIGKVGVPALAERTVGWRRGIIIECCLLTASLIWLVQVENWWMLSVFVIVYGLSYGGTASLIPAFIHYLFGTTSLGQIIGIAHAVSLMGGALGPLVAGYVIDQTGRYSIAFVIAAAASLLAAVSTLIVKPPRK